MQKSIKTLSRQYFLKNHLINKTFIPGVTPVKVSGRVFDEKEIENAIKASLEFWLTEGHFTEEFCKKFSKFLGVRLATLVNSGSSANLAAFFSLTSPKLGNRQIKKGDEVIIPDLTFVATANAISNNGATPVLADVNTDDYNILVILP